MSTTRARETRRNRAPTRRLVTVRRWLLSGVAVLAAVLVALVVYQQHRARHLLADLPRRLGVDIQSETSGFTYTQSVKGRVLFTVHAAKAIQRQNGKTTLHDVSIVVHPVPGLNRPDTISGEHFEYDQTNGVIQAVGVVHLDLAAPKSESGKSRAQADRIAVTTNGLLYLQKLGVLATDEPLQIVYGDLHGSARGADYDTDTGLLHLRADVKLDGLEDGKPVHVTAVTADLNRIQRTAKLRSAHVEVAGDRSAGDSMLLTSASGSSPRTLDADDNVTVDTMSGEHLSSNHVRANVDGGGHLQQVNAQGSVQLEDSRYKATAGTAVLQMDPRGHPQQTELSTSVRISLAHQPGQASNELIAPHVVFHLLSEGSHAELNDLTADGGAVLSSLETTASPQPGRNVPRKDAQGQRVTTLTARSLHATTAVDNGVRYIAAVDGLGDTKLEQTDSLGNRRVSNSDVLHAVLLPPSAGTHAPSQTLLRAAVQTGHVEISQHKVLPAAQGARVDAPRTEDDHATAQQAEWDNVGERMRLTGSPVITGPGVQLAGDTITLSQTTNSTDAAGHVRGILQRSATDGSDPVHVLAERGHIESVTGAAEFFGEAAPVRLWTTTSQLEAAEVDVRKADGILLAHSTAHASMSDVRLVLNQENASSSPAGKSKQRDSIQVRGQQMTMSAEHEQTPSRIETTGDVHVSSSGNDLRADRVVATLNLSAAPNAQAQVQPASATSILPGGGRLKTMTATGNVTLQQPGRTARGQELVYTAKDDQYRLTGLRDKPAFMHDSLHGDITGASLIFHGGSERAEVAGEASRPVRTEVPAPPGRSR